MKEKQIGQKKNGMAVLAVTILEYLIGIVVFISGIVVIEKTENPVLLILGIIWIAIGWIPFLGLKVLKFFPAEQSGGLAKIKAMAAPFPMFKVMPTGGISLKNLGEYLSCPTICACGGSYMVTADLIDNQKWDEITELCKKSVEIVKSIRG